MSRQEAYREAMKEISNDSILAQKIAARHNEKLDHVRNEYWFIMSVTDEIFNQKWMQQWTK